MSPQHLSSGVAVARPMRVPGPMRTLLMSLLAVTPAGFLAAQVDSTGPAFRPEIARYVDFFTGAGRPLMQQFLNRGAAYRDDIRARLEQRGLPRAFEFLPLIESGYSNHAVSRAGAVGMWQFIPETARQYGLRVDQLVDERRDPGLATDAAIRHIDDLSRAFGSPLLAAAAYNGGAGRVRRSVARLSGAGDDPIDFFDLSDKGLLAKETRDYVPKLLAAAAIGADPARYGFSIPAATRKPADSLPVDRNIRLDQVAQALGIPARVLADHNPALRKGVAPTASWLKVPAGLGDSLRLKLPNLPAVPVATWSSRSAPKLGPLIRVRRGDSLETLASLHGVGIDALRRANALPKGYRLRPGMALRLPGA